MGKKGKKATEGTGTPTPIVSTRQRHCQSMLNLRSAGSCDQRGHP